MVEITLKNGMWKVKSDSAAIYPLSEVAYDGLEMKFFSDHRLITTQFEDVSTNFGTTTPDGLLDYLADNGSISGGGGSGGGGGGTIDISTLAKEAKQDRSVWTQISGNSTDITYYSGTGGGANPSGNKNVQSVAYKTGTNTVFTQTLSYDADDDVVNVTTT